jgi:DNA-binding GntR family transcriptional regulator
MSTSLRAVSLVEALAAELRNAIFRGELAPGLPVSEVSLSRRYDVARPSVRAALQSVVADGLLRREPNRSVYVPRLGVDDVRDLFGLRRLLELDATGTLVDRRARPTAMRRALRGLEALADGDGWDEVVTQDFTLHQALVDAAGSPRMSRVYAGIAGEVRLAITQLRPAYSSPREIAAEHRVLVEAISSGDRRRALDTVRQHLDESERLLVDQLDPPERARP